MAIQGEIRNYGDCGECPYNKEDYDGQAYFPPHLEAPCLDCMNKKMADWEERKCQVGKR